MHSTLLTRTITSYLSPEPNLSLFASPVKGHAAERICRQAGYVFLAIAQDFSYAVEGMLGPLYRDMLASHAKAHVYHHWSFMPSLAE
jgi:hypothetical protein